ncbi:MAG: hypothetical protein JWQ71_3250 [Pedosphaera sp.]|nr:hypothetical protein [Pedosphaera sp.]
MKTVLLTGILMIGLSTAKGQPGSSRENTIEITSPSLIVETGKSGEGAFSQGGTESGSTRMRVIRSERGKSGSGGNSKERTQLDNARMHDVLILAQAEATDPTELQPPPAPGAAPVAPRQPLPPRMNQAQRTAATANLDRLFINPGAEGGALVIRSSDGDPKSLSTAKEDLSVMSRILEKSLTKGGAEDDYRVMGIRLLSSGGGVKSMQIEGYGAIFLLNVNFPLTGPAEKSKEVETKEPANSTWEEAKRELYGNRRATPGVTPFAKPQMEAYDPKRVEDLKESLVQALKYAGNIRNLNVDDVVTVVVSSEGGNATFWAKKLVVENGGGGFGGKSEYSIDDEDHVKPAPHPKSTLTLRAKRADIEGFARGKISLDAFRKKVAMALY